MKDLVKLQPVCKQWYAIVQDRHFIERHMTPGTRKVIYNQIPSSPCTYETFQMICGCDGLLLQKSNVTQKYHIENPTTHQILELPDPNMTSLAMTFNFVRSSSEYKLVSIYGGGTDESGAFCEVLTVGGDNSWRPLKIPNSKDVDKRERRLVASSNSVVHCFEVSTFSREVVSLDLETKRFTVATLSNDMFPDWEKVWALNWRGKLAFSHIIEEDLQVLVLDDYKKRKWGEGKMIVPLAFVNKIRYVKGDLVPIMAESENVWFWLKDKIILPYNMKIGCTRNTVSAAEWCKITNTFYAWSPSLVTFKGMKPEKPLNKLQG